MANRPIQAEVVGTERVVGRFTIYGQAAREGVEEVVEEYTKKIYQTARELTDGDGSGNIYQRPWGQHQASAPGEPPAKDTGRLRASIRMILQRLGGLVVGKVIAGGKLDVDYAAVLEYGTRSAEGMAARPFMKPSLQEHAEDFVQALIAVLKAA